MAMTFHSIERLGAPFSSVSELGFVIPEGGEVTVHNAGRKILFYLQADATMEIDQLGVYRVRTGDVFVIPCRCEQHIRITERGQSAKVHALKIAFAMPPLAGPGTRHEAGSVRGNPEADFSAFVRHHFRQIRHLPGAQTAAMREILRAIRRDAEDHPPGIRHRVRALATNLVVHVARMVHENPAPARVSAPTPAPLVNQVKEYLLRNYARELSLGEIAWHVHKSEEHVARIFRKVTGQTVFEYLRTVRLESAKTLLINSDKALTEIARLSGFGSLALFSRNFTHYVGLNASAYRQERAKDVTWREP